MAVSQVSDCDDSHPSLYVNTAKVAIKLKYF